MSGKHSKGGGLRQILHPALERIARSESEGWKPLSKSDKYAKDVAYKMFLRDGFGIMLLRNQCMYAIKAKIKISGKNYGNGKNLNTLTLNSLSSSAITNKRNLGRSQ